MKTMKKNDVVEIALMIVVSFSVLFFDNSSINLLIRLPVFLILWTFAWLSYKKIVQNEIRDTMILCEECKKLNKISAEVEEKVDGFLKEKKK